MTTKALTQSIQQKLRNVATKEKTTYENILNSFLLECMAARLLKDPQLTSKLIFKGGFIGLRIFESPRYTIDLDALVQGADVKKISELAKKTIESDIGDGVWFAYEKQSDLQTLGEYGGVRLYFRTGIGEPLKNIKKAQLLHLDLGVGDAVIPAPVTTETKSIIGNDSLTWQVYTIESSSAEKLHALIMRADNSRSKDVFDLYHFLPKCNQDILRQAIQETFKARNDKLPKNISKHIKNTDYKLLQQGWKSVVAGIKHNLDFNVAFEFVARFCKDL